MKKFIFSLISSLVLACGASSCVDDDPMAENYYTFTGEMVTTYLENRSNTFSEYITILKRAKLWDLLSTYGEFTCFAPTNDAINDYLRQQGLSSLDQLDDATCDTLAWQHLIKATYFTTDIGEGSLPTTNLNNRYLTFTCDTIDHVSHYFMNANSEMIARDDSVRNGVVHTLSRVLSSSSIFIGDAIIADSACTIFGQALELTGLNDTLSLFMDSR